MDLKKIIDFIISKEKKIIILEGLDVSGKASTAKLLKDHYGENAFLIDFPRYETEIGKKIKEKLISGDKKEIELLFIEDRKKFWEEDFLEIEQQYIIMDRLHWCNLAYNGVTMAALEEEADFRLIREQVKFGRNSEATGIHTFLFLKTTKEAEEKHKQYIESKKHKDSNETIEFQNKVNKTYKSLLKRNVIHFDATTDEIIEIGTPFEEIIKLILSK